MMPTCYYNDTHTMAAQEELPLSCVQSGRWRPSWRRPGLAHKTSLRGTLSRDLPVHDTIHNEATQRILQLEKNVLFMREQHKDTLSQLHTEIERLKNENRELHFNLVMCRGSEASGGGDSVSDEVHSLRTSLAQEKTRNHQLKALIERKVLEQEKSYDSDCTIEPCTVVDSRPPTLAEAERMITYLQQTSNQQSHELQQIKADLRDVLYSHKWTPDAFLLARAYVAEDKANTSKLPRISTKTTHMYDRAYRRVREEVTLPSLTPHVTTSFPHRQKRTAALRNKLKPSLQ